MAKVTIPNSNRVFSQPNDGKLKGNVYSSFNMDFSANPGKVNVSSRLKIITSSNTNDASSTSSLGYPVAVRFVFGRWRIVCGTDANDGRVVINAGNPTDAYSFDPAANVPINLGILSDAEVFNNKFYVSSPLAAIVTQSADLGAWASAGGTTHATYFNFLKAAPNSRMYYPASGGRIGYMTTGEVHVVTGAGTISPGVDQQPTCADFTKNRMWIGTFPKTSFTEGTIIEWDMSDQSEQANEIHKIGATGVLGIRTCKKTPYALCSDGSLKKYDGSGFEKVAQFPSYISKDLIEFYTGFDLYTITTFMHPNGMDVVDGKLQFNIRAVKKTTSKNNLFPEMPSGIWEFDPDNPERGIYHKYSFTIDQAGQNDFGQFLIARPGVLKETKHSTASIIAGAGYYTDTSTTHKAIFTDNLSTTGTKRGIFTTPELFTGNPQDNWHDAFIIHEPYINDTDTIISKYKYKERKNLPFVAAITWTSTTTFTSIDTDFNFVVGGEEVLIVRGKGGGTTAHVSSISVSSGTYTITLDEAVGFSSGTATVLIDNWTKIAVHASQDTLFSEIPMTGITQPKIQYRFEIRGQPEINQFLINSTKQK